MTKNEKIDLTTSRVYEDKSVGNDTKESQELDLKPPLAKDLNLG